MVVGEPVRPSPVASGVDRQTSLAPGGLLVWQVVAGGGAVHAVGCVAFRLGLALHPDDAEVWARPSQKGKGRQTMGLAALNRGSVMAAD